MDLRTDRAAMIVSAVMVAALVLGLGLMLGDRAGRHRSRTEVCELVCMGARTIVIDEEPYCICLR